MRFVVAFVIALGLAGAASADSGSAEQPTDVTAAPRKPTPPELMRERQKIEEAGGGGRSGFWTSRQPAKGGAYRWRLLLIGLGLIGITGGGITLLIKRANRANAAPRPWDRKPADTKSADSKPAEPADSKSASKPEDAPTSAES